MKHTRTSVQDADARFDKGLKKVLTVLAALGAIGVYYLLQEYAPGPAGAPRFYNRAIDAYNDRKNDEAKRWFDRAIEVDSEYHPAYFGRALLHRRLNEVDAAIADYTTVIRLKPDHADAFYNRGLIYGDLGQPEKALADFDAYVRLKPAAPDGYMRRVEIFRGVGDLTRALADQDALVRMSDKYLPYYFARSALERDFGDLAGAMHDVETAVSIAPNDPEALFQRGLLRRQTGDVAGAIADFEQAIAIKAAEPQPSGVLPDDMRFRLARGEALRDSGQVDAAKAEFEAAIKRQTSSATAFQQRGLLELFLLGDATAAAADLDAAVRNGIQYRDMMRFTNYGIRAVERQLGAPPTTPVDDPPVIDRDVPFYPTIYWLVIWRQLARMHAASPDAPVSSSVPELSANRWQNVDITGVPVRTPLRRRLSWPLPIWLMFIGKATPEVVRRAAGTAPGAYERRLRLCEADFYAAELDLAKGTGDEAHKLLQAAVDGCPTAAPEATFAKAELQRLH